jgi:hypothetical protein
VLNVVQVLVIPAAPFVKVKIETAQANLLSFSTRLGYVVIGETILKKRARTHSKKEQNPED